MKLFKIAICLLFIISVISMQSCDKKQCKCDYDCCCGETDSENKITTEDITSNVTTENTKLFTIDELKEKIHIGMTPDEISALLGVEGEDVGSGLAIYVWKLDDITVTANGWKKSDPITTLKIEKSGEVVYSVS